MTRVSELDAANARIQNDIDAAKARIQKDVDAAERALDVANTKLIELLNAGIIVAFSIGTDVTPKRYICIPEDVWLAKDTTPFSVCTACVSARTCREKKDCYRHTKIQPRIKS